MRATVASGPVTMRREMSGGSGTRAGTIEICPNTMTSKSPALATFWAISRSCVATSPLVLIPIDTMREVTFGRVMAGHACYEIYHKYLKRTVEEPFVLFLPG